MVKKNKDIQVNVTEEMVNTNQQALKVTKLTIGKKTIGQIIPNENKHFIVEISGKNQAITNTIDEGIEYIIRQWNLFE